MSEGRSEGQAESRSVGSSQDSTWLERRQKRREDRERGRGEEESGLGEGSDLSHQTISGAAGHRQRDGRDQELEWLRRLLRDLELEVKGWCHRRDRDNRKKRDDSVGNRGEESSSQFGPRRFQERSLSRESH